MKTIVVGIDPGLNNGIAIYRRVDKGFELKLYKEDFWNTVESIKKIADQAKQHSYQLTFLIECPQHNKPVFLRTLKGSKSGNMDMKIAQDIGMNKKVAILLVEYLKRLNLRHCEITPTKSKMKSGGFEKLTGIKKSNEHCRDAAMLIIDNGYTHFKNVPNRNNF